MKNTPSFSRSRAALIFGFLLAVAHFPAHAQQGSDSPPADTVPTGSVLSSKTISRQIEVEGKVSFSNILFRINSTEFANEESLRQIKEIATALKAKARGGAKFQIEGHTCDLGTEPHNLTLSQRRAQAVRAHLIALEVPASVLSTIGRGEASPLKPNSSEANRALNRRVVVVLSNS